MFCRRLLITVAAAVSWLVEFIRRRGPRFADLAREVLEEKKLRAPGTFALAKIVLGRLTLHFGHLRVGEIAEAHWREYISQRRAQRPGCTLFDDKKFMTQVLLLAHRRGHVARRIVLWIPEVPTSGGREVTPDELKRLLKAAGPELRFQIEIAYKMGLRRKELLSLRWETFDWKRKVIAVYSTKTKRKREVPINADLFEKFRRRYRSSKSPCVFPGRVDPNRSVIDHKTAWQRCKRKAGVKARWYDLRHTCATVMLRRGATPSATARVLGHSERVLREIYEHLNVGDLHRAASVMAERRRRASSRRRRQAAGGRKRAVAAARGRR